MKTKGIVLFLAFAVLALAVLFTAGCGGKLSSNGGAINCGGCGANPYPVTISLFGPSTCSPDRGFITHFYVTVSGVQMNASPTATPDSSGWFDVMPSLASSPKQIDLFALTPGNLGTGEAKIGDYGSVRFFLAPNTTILSANSCGTGSVNCVSDGTSTAAIEVSAESTRGIVINRAAMAGTDNGISIGSASKLNILFDACASLDGGAFAPKATAWSGAIQTYNITLNDSNSGNPIQSSTAIVAMEKTDAAGVDRIIAQAGPDPSGSVKLVGPVGPVDFVIDGRDFVNNAFVTWAPQVITGVTGTGTAPLAMTVNLTPLPNNQPPTVVGQRIESGSTAIDFRISVLQQAEIAGTKTPFFTVPIFNSLSSEYVNETYGCNVGFCSPAGFDAPGQSLTLQNGVSGTPTVSTAPLTYKVEVNAFRLKSAGAPDCTTPTISSTVTVSPGGSTTAPTAQFTGCQ